MLKRSASAIVPARTTASVAVRERRGKAARWREYAARAWVRGSIEEKLSQNPATGRKEEKRRQAAALEKGAASCRTQKGAASCASIREKLLAGEVLPGGSGEVPCAATAKNKRHRSKAPASERGRYILRD